MLQSEYALYGITEGIMSINCDLHLTCGVVCSGWPSWAFGVQARRIEVQFFVFKDNAWRHLIWVWFPHAGIFVYDKSFLWIPVINTVDIWLSDTNIPLVKLHIFESSASIVITQRRSRQVPSGVWKYSPLSMKHVDCSGIMDGEWCFHIFFAKFKSPCHHLLRHLSL
jgi:hypothetical protein